MRRLYVNGDSLAVGTMWFLPQFLPGVKITEEAKVGKHAATGLEEIMAHRFVEDAIYVSLGTNDYPSAMGTAAFEVVVAKVVRKANGKPVVWSNIHRPKVDGLGYGAFNRVLNRFQRDHENFYVHRWDATARNHPQWFGPDGIHPGTEGYKARAGQVARVLLRWG